MRERFHRKLIGGNLALNSVQSQTLSLVLSSVCCAFPMIECWRQTRALKHGSSPLQFAANALALLTACSSSFVYPLDWGEPWQLWPIPTISGVLVGYAIRDLVRLAAMVFDTAGRTR